MPEADLFTDLIQFLARRLYAESQANLNVDNYAYEVYLDAADALSDVAEMRKSGRG